MSDKSQWQIFDILAIAGFILQSANVQSQDEDRELLKTIIENQNKIMSMLEQSKSV